MVRAMRDQGVGGGAGPRYGLLGGTFDPPHFAHLALAQEARVRLGLDRVYFIPTGQSPHKLGRAVSRAADRRAMVELAIAGEPRFALLAVELERAGPSYTADTLRRLRAEWGSAADVSLIVGWDMLVDLPHWREPDVIVGTADHVIAVRRPGYDETADDLRVLARALPLLTPKLVVLEAPQLAISASMLRQRVASGMPIRYFVPDDVARYIHDHGLYRPANRGLAAESHMVTGSGGMAGSTPAEPAAEREVGL
jgi:nicotinate-nucleotide adenylyltransferase